MGGKSRGSSARGSAFRRAEQVGNLAGQDPVDLLRHRAIEGAQPGFHMDHRDSLLDGHQAARERGSHVADDDDARRLEAVEDRFKAFHDLGRLHGMRAGANLEVDVRLRQTEVLEDTVLHARIVVLPSVKQHRWRQVRPRT